MFRDFLVGGTSSLEKHLDKIFKFCLRGFLATWSGDLFMTHFSRDNHMFCTLRIILKKNFSVFPRSFWLFIILSVHLSHKLTVFLSKNPPFSSSLLQTSRKGMGFLFFSNYFMFIAFDFLVFELLLRFEKCDVWIWVGFILLSLLNGFCWYWKYNACFTCLHAYVSFF